jgi:[ribosomal protein S5]-alanine N-acetyltransferase
VTGRLWIETARLTLRPVSLDDLEALHRLWATPAVRRYIWDGEVISKARAEGEIREALRNFERHGFGLWVVEEGRRLIGFCGLRHLDHGPEVEILYGISPSRWGRGFATEVAVEMLRYGFHEAGLDRILGIADRENVASWRVLEQIGMTFDEQFLHEGREEAHYSIRREEFRPSVAPG